MMQYDATRRYIGTCMRALVRDFAKINLLLLYRTFCYNEKKKNWGFYCNFVLHYPVNVTVLL